MLTEERYAAILKLVDERKAVTVLELMDKLHSSESTVRRDLTALHKMGKLNKVHGGATSLVNNYSIEEEEISAKYSLNVPEKRQIAKCAAALIKSKDFVYIDAGTTTEMMLDYITEKNAIYVTNAVGHAKKLAQKNLQVYVIAGKFKASTEAIIGSEAVSSLQRYNFTIGFFGTNGISLKNGYTTPDIDEARIKTEAMAKCKQNYILADYSKFNKISTVTFGRISSAAIITNTLQDKQYQTLTRVLEVGNAE